MIVEVVAVGTELLIGQTVNTNSAVIGERLAAAGFDAHYQTTVGDNLERLHGAISDAAVRADAVVLTGGIGPTQDDITREALCAFAGVGMVRDQAHEQAIRERLLDAHGVVTEMTLRMADHPDGAEPLANPTGVALGIAMEHEGTHLFAVPGVPSEMVTMIDEQVIPRLRSLVGEPAVLESRVLRTFGYGESQVAELLDDLYGSANPSLAYLIDAAEVRVRISAKAESVEDARRLIRDMDRAVVERLGPTAVFGRDEETIEALVVSGLAERGWTIATVETSTLGVVGTRIAEIAGPGPVYAGTRVLRSERLTGDVATRSLELLNLSAMDADVIVGVSEVSSDDNDPDAARWVGVAVRTPEGAASRSVPVLGDEARARRFSVPNALQAARLAIRGDWWSE
jgi:nicotinamide-nucleotide amidase